MRALYRSTCSALVLLLAVPSAAGADPVQRGAARDPIVIGLHAPLTGAAPLPSRSLQDGSDLYWRWLKRRGRTIYGRNVKVVLRNDNTSPSQAAKVCRQMIENDGAFLLAGVLQGASGSYQSEVCARLAASLGVPYVSLGGGTNLVDDLPQTFAISMTFPAQGRLLADYFVEKLKARSRKNGIVAYDTPHHREATRPFRKRLEKRKAEVHYQRSIARAAGAQEAQTVAAELQTAGIDNAFVFTTPSFFLQLLQAANTIDYHPRWSGIGISFTNSDSLVRLACSGSQPFRGRFFSPVPAFDDRDAYDRTFDRARRAIYPGGANDAVVWQGWSTARQLAEMLRATGRRLTTRRFIDRVEAADDLTTGILPAVNFTARDHFGASRTHVLFPRCSDERWHTRSKLYH